MEQAIISRFFRRFSKKDEEQKLKEKIVIFDSRERRMRPRFQNIEQRIVFTDGSGAILIGNRLYHIGPLLDGNTIEFLIPAWEIFCIFASEKLSCKYFCRDDSILQYFYPKENEGRFDWEIYRIFNVSRP